MKVDKKEIYDILPDYEKGLIDKIENAISDISNGVNVQDRISEIDRILHDLTLQRDKELLNPSVSSAINKAINELLLLKVEALARSGNQ